MKDERAADMRSEFTHTVAPGLLRAEPGTSPFGGSTASAQAHITLAVIGAVGIAGPGLIRRAGDSDRWAEAGRSHTMRVARVEAELRLPTH
jgi:hypothetical protein